MFPSHAAEVKGQDVPLKIIGLTALDVRFPTSRSLDGSDAMRQKPDYSAAYVVLHTDDAALSGHGLGHPRRLRRLPGEITAIKAGTQAASVAQHPAKIGSLGIATLYNAVLGKKVAKNVDTGTTLITQQNAK
jgi:hypothetical protein